MSSTYFQIVDIGSRIADMMSLSANVSIIANYIFTKKKLGKKMVTESKKTVFFLGAGFSIPAGVPLQSKILNKVIELSQRESNLSRYKKLNAFLGDGFSRKDYALASITLEDIFSPLDRCISENASFRGYSRNDLVKYRDLMANLISEVISDNIDSNKNQYITDYILKTSRYEDLAIITSNWDNLIEKSFYNMNPDDWIIDYGSHDIELEPAENVQLGQSKNEKTGAHKTLKLYKIHGSIDWYSCPVCSRIFIQKKQVMSLRTCISCKEMFTSRTHKNSRIVLNRSLILPTFLKEFSTFHYKSIWHKFHRELSEARKLVLIGYSLPAADHEIRQSFLRFVPDNCNIKVVDLLEDENKKEAFKSNYKNLFGKRKIEFEFGGVEKYIMSMP